MRLCHAGQWRGRLFVLWANQLAQRTDKRIGVNRRRMYREFIHDDEDGAQNGRHREAVEVDVEDVEGDGDIVLEVVPLGRFLVHQCVRDGDHVLRDN